MGVERLEERVVLDGEPVLGAASYSYSLNEDASLSTNIGTVTATDPESQPVTFSFGGDYSGSPFEIDENTGVITLNAPLDYEAAASYSLNVYAVDSDGNFSSSPVTITVNDVSGDPVFGSSSYSFSIDEDEPIGTAVGSVSATGTGTLTYRLSKGLEILSINSATGALTLQSELNYEEVTSFSGTVIVTDGNDVSTSATLTVTINNVDETPDGNMAPSITSLSFTVTTDGQGYAIGDLMGAIFDDYLTEGEFTLEVDIWYDYSIDVVDYALSSATSIYAEIQLPYGTTPVSVRLIETEAETGQQLEGDWYHGFITVAPPSNSAPTITNLAYTPDTDDGYGGLGYLSGDINDTTRLYGSYKIELDWNGDGIADDYGDFPLDALTFAYEHWGSPVTNYTARFRVVEYDDNAYGTANYELFGAWSSITFTTADITNNPPIIDQDQSNSRHYDDEGGYGVLDLYFSDDTIRNGTSYSVELDYDGDGIADYTEALQDTSGQASLTLPSGGPTSATTIRIRVVESNPVPESLVTPWVEIPANGGTVTQNQIPTFSASSFSKTLSRDPTATNALANGVVAGLIASATDTDGPNALKYSIKQVAEVTRFGFPGSPWLNDVPKVALSIDENTGQISVIDKNVIQNSFDKDHTYTATVIVRDGLDMAEVQVTLIDDYKYFLAESFNYISLWNSRTLAAINWRTNRSAGAVTSLENFVGSSFWYWTNATGVAASATALGISIAGAAGVGVAATGGLALGGIGLSLFSLIGSVVGLTEAAGNDAIFNKIKTQLQIANAVAHNSRIERHNFATNRYNTVNAALNPPLGTPDNKTPLEKVQEAAALLTEIKSTLGIIPGAVPAEPAPGAPIPANFTAAENQIFGHLIREFGRKKGWLIRGSAWHQNQFGTYWYADANYANWPLKIDAPDVVNQLNAMNWRG